MHIVTSCIMPERSSFVIAVGASAGGLNAISELVSQLPSDLDGSVFVVLHLSKAALGDILVSRIQKNTSLPCKIAEDKEIIKTGHVYIAPPDAHLLVKEDHVIIGHGPAENRFRPSIDVLFRSVAASHGERTIGIILTGFLNDGTAGMMAIKQSGGYCIVQDPNEAEYPDMPLAVLENMEVDDCVSLKNMGKVIVEIINKAEVKGVAAPQNIISESKLSEKSATGINGVRSLGEKTVYACPDCGGGLWKIENGKIKHYRCHIGHSYSENDLLLKQSETTEHTLWVAVRMMEERKLFLQKIAKENDEKGLQRLSSQYNQRSKELEQHISTLKELLFAINKD